MKTYVEKHTSCIVISVEVKVQSRMYNLGGNGDAWDCTKGVSGEEETVWREGHC